MKVSKSAAVGLLVALGFRSAGSKTIKELVKKLQDIPDFVDLKSKDLMKKVGEYKDLLNKILVALKKKEEIVVEGDPKGPPTAQAKKATAKAAVQEEDDDDSDDEEEESEDAEDADEDSEDESESEEDEESEEEESEDEDGEESEDEEETDEEADSEAESEDEDSDEDEEEEPAPKKKVDAKGKTPVKGAAGKKDAKAQPKEKKSTVATDKWGCKIGTRAARLNAAITGKPKTAKQIQTDAKYDKPIHGHLRFLVTKGFVVNENGKYRSKQGGEPIKTTKTAAPTKPAPKAAAKAPVPVKKNGKK